jgi:ribosome maturation factor RimP
MPSGVPRRSEPGEAGESGRTGMRDLSTKSSTVQDALVSTVNEAGFDLEEVKVVRAGRREIVRVVVDSDSGVDLDAIAHLSRVISEILDGESLTDLLDDGYQLEVSSPGVDRPLTEPRHWRRASGRLVSVEVDGKRVTGRVLSADTDGVILGLEGDSLTVSWSDLGAGRVQVEFNRDGRSSVTGQTGEG